STMTVFRNSQNTMKVTKKIRSRRLTTPRVKSWNRSITAMRRAMSASTGVLRDRKSVTTGYDATAKTKHTVTASTKAITWFLVSAESGERTARKAPATTREPT